MSRWGVGLLVGGMVFLGSSQVGRAQMFPWFLQGAGGRLSAPTLGSVSMASPTFTGAPTLGTVSLNTPTVPGSPTLGTVSMNSPTFPGVPTLGTVLFP